NLGMSHFYIFCSWYLMSSLGDHLSRQEQLRVRLLSKNKKLDELRALGSLTAGFMHEFASPLNTIKVRLQRLSRIQDGEDLQAALRALESCEAVLGQMNSSEMEMISGPLQKVTARSF